MSSNGGLASLTQSAAAGIHASVRGAELLTQTANGDGTFAFSGDRNVDAVLIGSRWTGETLTFTFPKTGDYGPADFAANQLPFNAQQEAAARAAFALVEGYTNLTISEVAPGGADEPTFKLSQTLSPSVPSAQGSFPGYVNGDGGQIWFGRSEQPYYEAPQKGNWGNATIMHEIGHTLGLKHGMDDYSSENIGESLGDGSVVLHGSQAIEYGKDGQAWSLMTYTPGPNSATSFEGEGANQPQSYMQLDIAALQYLYGANYVTNAGDTVYRWDAATGEKSLNGVGQGAPAGNKIFETVWDGGGTDTYDFSNYGGGVSVDLRPGMFSTFSVEQVANGNGLSGGNLPAPGNVANALLHGGDVRSLIENAIGGAGNDRIIGNQADNVLTGLAGDDVLAGGAGSDTLIGGAGNDVADFAGATTGIVVTLNDDTAAIRVANGGDIDTLSGMEGVIGTAFDDVLTGDGGANVLGGGEGGVDILSGGAGNDTLIGGGYRLAYRDEADIVRTASGENKSRETAIDLMGAFELATRATQSTTAQYGDAILPHATVVAVASALAGNDWYRIDATAGARALFDIDSTNNYSGIEIVDAAGRIVAFNYNEMVTDDGSRSGYDARLAYTFQQDGIFYVRITSSTADGVPQDMAAGQSYTLHVALEDAPVAAPELRATASAIVDGGAGDDLIFATAGNDRIDGGAGSDTLSYRNHYQGVTVALGVAGVQAIGGGSAAIAGIENLTGSAHADRLTGDGGDNVIDGGGGDDVVSGGDGTDTLSFASQAAGVTASLAAQGGVQAYAPGRTIDASGFENLAGGAFADSLTGDAGANVLSGGAGDDVLAPGIAARAGIVDTLDGGAGTDTASFAAFVAGVTATLGIDGTPGMAAVAGDRVAVLTGIENLTGGGGNDVLRGNGLVNVLTGGAGDDILSGLAGDDVLDGGLGDDVLHGGAGTDTAVFAGAVAVTVDLMVTTAQDTGHGRDMLDGIENLRGGSGNDILGGDGGDNVFFDAGGDDSYDGRGGADTVDYGSAVDRVIVDLGIAGAQATGGGGEDLLTGIENVRGGDGGNYLTGSDGDNRLTGGTGSDLLTGGLGGDVLVGGAGDDLLTGDGFALADGVDPATMRDVLQGGAGRDTLIGGAGDDMLSGGEDDDFLSNGTFASAVFADTWSRGMLLHADGGNDVIDGGAGLDFAVLAYYGRSEGITLDVRDPTATSVIYSGGVAAGSIAGVEKLGFEGGEGNDIVHGGAGYDFLAGHGGDDFIDAGLGNDTVYYDGGNDTLLGGGGYDVVSFEQAAGGVAVDLRLPGGQQTGLGMLTLVGFSSAVASAFGDTLYLTDYGNQLFDTGTGDDSFHARGGDDALYVSRSGGDASTILLDGGDGDDRLDFTSYRTSGDDRLRIDDVTILGGAGDEFITSTGAKRLTIDAGAGDDFLGVDLGGASGDNILRLTLGTGRDVVFLDSDATVASVGRTDAIVTDFAVADGDQIDLTTVVTGFSDPTGMFVPTLIGYANDVDPFATGHLRVLQNGADTLLQIDKDGEGGAFGFVTALTLAGVRAADLTTDSFKVQLFDAGRSVPVDPGLSQAPVQIGDEGSDILTGTEGRDRLIGHGGTDVLLGLGGDDALIGGTGDDFIDGGTGADVMAGGVGNDIYRVDNAGDQVFELQGGGTDTVETTVDWAMALDIENLRVANDARVSVTGNYLDNVISAGAGAVRFDGGGGNDALIGGAGDDRLIGGLGDDLLDGGAGRDTTVFSGTFLKGVTAAPGLVTVHGAQGTDMVRNVETLVFQDGTYVVDEDSAGAQIIRLYDAMLDRQPTAAEFDARLDQRQDAGVSLSALASTLFADAPLNVATRGLSNAAFVDHLYGAIFDRAADAGGAAFWNGQLDAGMSRSDVVLGFSEALEQRVHTASIVSQGYYDTDDTYRSVASLYDTFAGRLPDVGGLVGWAEAIKAGALTLEQVADGFAGSREFTALTAGFDHGQLVDYLYHTALDRSPEQAGRDYWVAALDNGLSNGDLLLGFSESAEHWTLNADHVVHGIDLLV